MVKDTDMTNENKDFSDFILVPNFETGSKDLFLTTEEEIDNCEKELDVTFLDDYKQYVLEWGRGILGGTYIRIFLPDRILHELQEWRERLDEFWFWEKGKDVLKKEEVLSSIKIGDTLDGDDIIFYENEYYIISINDETIYSMGESLHETITWLCSSGVLTEAFSEREFEPY